MVNSKSNKFHKIDRWISFRQLFRFLIANFPIYIYIYISNLKPIFLSKHSPPLLHALKQNTYTAPSFRKYKRANLQIHRIGISGKSPFFFPARSGTLSVGKKLVDSGSEGVICLAFASIDLILTHGSGFGSRQVQVSVPGRSIRRKNEYHHSVYVRQIRQYLSGAGISTLWSWC